MTLSSKMPRINKTSKNTRITRLRHKRNDLLAGKYVRRDSRGKECFEDYFTDQSLVSFDERSPRRSLNQTQKKTSNENDLNLNVEVPQAIRVSVTPKVQERTSGVSKRLSIVSLSAETAPNDSFRARKDEKSLTKARTRLSYDDDEPEDEEEDPVPNRTFVSDVSALKRGSLHDKVQRLSNSRTEFPSIVSSSKFSKVVDDDDLEIDDDIDFLRLDLTSAKSKRAEEDEQESFSDEDSADGKNDLNKHKNVEKESDARRSETWQPTKFRNQQKPNKLKRIVDSESKEESEDERPDSSVRRSMETRGSPKKSGHSSRVTNSTSGVKTKEQSLNLTFSKRDKSLANNIAGLESESSEDEAIASAGQKSGKSKLESGKKNSTLVNQQNVSPKWPSPWKVISVVADVGDGVSSSDSDAGDGASSNGSDSDYEPKELVKSTRANKSLSKGRSFLASDKSVAKSLDRNASRSYSSRTVTRSPSKLASSKRNLSPVKAQSRVSLDQNASLSHSSRTVSRSLSKLASSPERNLSPVKAQSRVSLDQNASPFHGSRTVSRSPSKLASTKRNLSPVKAQSRVSLDENASPSRHSLSVSSSPSKLASSSKRNSVAQTSKEFTSPKGNSTKAVRRSLVRPSFEPMFLDTSTNAEASTSTWGKRKYPKNNSQISSKNLDDEEVEDNVLRRSSRLRLSGGKKEQSVQKLDNSVKAVAISTSTISSGSGGSKRKLTDLNNLPNDDVVNVESPPKSLRLVEDDVELESSDVEKENKKQKNKKPPRIVEDDSDASQSSSKRKTNQTNRSESDTDSKRLPNSPKKKKNSRPAIDKETVKTKPKKKKDDEQPPEPSSIKKKNTNLHKNRSIIDEGHTDDSSLDSYLPSTQNIGKKPRNSLYSRDHVKRNRIRPLENWRNERPIYRRDSKGTFSFVGVDKGFARCAYDLMQLEMKTAKVKKRGPKAVVKESSEREEDLTIEHEDYVEKSLGPIAVINPMGGAEVFIDCLKVKEAYRFTSATGEEVKPEDTLVVAKPLRQKAFSSGVIILHPGAEKGMYFLVNDTMVFWVIKGTLEVTIHETTMIIKKGDSFFVPLGNKYNIHNLSKKQSELVFFQHRGD